MGRLLFRCLRVSDAIALHMTLRSGSHHFPLGEVLRLPAENLRLLKLEVGNSGVYPPLLNRALPIHDTFLEAIVRGD